MKNYIKIKINRKKLKSTEVLDKTDIKFQLKAKNNFKKLKNRKKMNEIHKKQQHILLFFL